MMKPPYRCLPPPHGRAPSGSGGRTARPAPRLRADSRPTLARLRESEQLAACRVLGVKRTIFLHYPDGELVADLGLRRALTRVIREVQPEVVLCGDPTAHFYGNSYVNHPDHRAAAQAACDAVFPSAH